jgi:hypothetical protein
VFEFAPPLTNFRTHARRRSEPTGHGGGTRHDRTPRNRSRPVPADAYVLCSLAGHLRIFEVLDAGVWAAS